MIFKRSLDYFRKYTGTVEQEGRPETISKIIQPIVDITPRITETVLGTTSTVTGTVSLVVSNIDRDFYITSFEFTYIKDANCDIPTGRIQCTAPLSGSSTSLTNIPVTTLTAEKDRVQVHYTYPMKLDRNATITMTGSFTAGSLSRYISVRGFYL